MLCIIISARTIKKGVNYAHESMEENIIVGSKDLEGKGLVEKVRESQINTVDKNEQ